MVSLETLSEFFKPETRKNGEDFVRKDQVFLSIAADTQVQAFIKAGTGARVNLKSKSIEASEIQALCSCPLFAKGTLCKHVWATLLAVEKKHPDFLESKTEISANAVEESPATAARKEKQAEFKKAQSARLKERNKQQRLEKKKQKRESHKPEVTYPAEVQAALDFFDQNGFPLKDDMTEEAIQFAKKKLARIFHPDIGGSHDEIVTLNHHSQVLLKNLS